MSLLPVDIIKLSEAVITRLPETITGSGIIADILRLDRIDPVISGNKWFKLKYYLEQTVASPHKTLLTFGGAYSNHILATAAAANKCGLKSIGIIRGEEPKALSSTLRSASAYGMELNFISRAEYQLKNENDFIQELQVKFGDAVIIPEGGAGPAGVKGAREIWQLVDRNLYSHVMAAAGTATMVAGLAAESLEHQQIIGIPVLKGFDPLTLPPFLNTKPGIKWFPQYHFGGYAKANPELFRFMNSWYQQTGIPSDFVYTGKLFYAVQDLLNHKQFQPGSRLLVIHSGGLQGNNSLPPKTLIF